MGPKAMFSGGLAGAALGTVAGGISVGVMKLTGTTAEDIRYWKKGWREAETRYLLDIEQNLKVCFLEQDNKSIYF